MTKWLWSVLVAVSLSVSLAGQGAKPPTPTLAERAKHATAILVAQNDSGGMDVRCTATAFKRDGHAYEFVSAAHCVGPDDTKHEKVADSSKQAFYITFDEKHTKKYWEAKLKAVGLQGRGDDFSVFSVESEQDTPEWVTIPLGDEKKETPGSAIINPAAPLGLGIQLFRGNISSLELDRPVAVDDIMWRGAMLIQLAGVAGGSSGSALISETQQAIIGFLVGQIGGTQTIAMPVTRFKEFLSRYEEGKYPWKQEEK